MTKFYLSISRLMTVLLVLVSTFAWAQSRTVTGKVTSSDDGSTIPGVNIVEKGTSNGAITDASGNYSLTVSSDAAVLVFSFVGFKNSEVAVGSQSTINVVLESDITALSEVVVIGYGQIEKKDATGALVSLSPKDFNSGIINSPEQLIQGRAAGVQITSASGEPGAGINIRIRGTSSVRSGNNPLFVVDGVPLSGDNTTGGGNQGSLGSSAARNPLNFLNPNDIASIDILKDASATAIYGSRGANGVVIITTKSGKGSGTLDYSYNLSVSKITKKYDLLEREEFLDAYETFNNPAARQALDQGADTDWQDVIFRTAISQSHNIAFGGGDKSSNYRFSLSSLDQTGIVENTGLKRYSARFNGSKSFINDRLTIATQMTLASTKDTGAPITDNSGFEGDLLGSALKSNPTMPIRDANGVLVQPNTTSEPSPAAIIEYSRDFTNAIRGMGNISGELKLFKGLSFKTVLGFDRSFSSRKAALSRDLVVAGVQNKGRLWLIDIQIDNRLMENYFTYDTQLGSNAKLNAVLGYSYQYFNKGEQAFQFTNFQTSDLDLMINNFASANQRPSGDVAAGYKAGVVGTNSSLTTDELQSYFGRVNVTIAEKYILTATLRADGSTKFGPENKYGYFPSAALKWRASEEGFVPELFDDLSLRVGYGVTGNQEFDHNRYDARSRYGNWNLDNDMNISGGGISTVANRNPFLKWESTKQFNIGIDYGFFSNRLRGSLDYYNKNTSDLLIQTIYAQPSLQEFRWNNLDANVINKGFEISLEADVVAGSDFKWTVIANGAYNKNVVENFSGKFNTGGINGQGLSGAFAQRIQNGLPLFAWWVRDFYGYDENGNANSGVNYPGSDVQSYHGSAIPLWNAGLTNNLTYKNFDLSIFFTGQFGHKVYNNTANAFFSAGSLANGRNATKDVPTSGEGKLNSPDVSTRFLEDGSFMRLQNVTLGYSFNTANTFISRLKLFVTGQNLFVITDYSGQDPEVNTNKSLDGIPSLGIDYTSYPRARTFTIGVNASF